jgi:uncharacterized membrane protein YphA (DoxX/SURF4 family)
MVARSAEVQIVERTAWAQDAVRQHQTTRGVPAPRGRILDRNGGELAVLFCFVFLYIAFRGGGPLSMGGSGR